jgi:hypothetical protein
LNDAMTDNTAQPQFQPAKFMSFDEYISSMANIAPDPQNTYRHPPTTNIMGNFPFHNPPSLHSSQYSNTVRGDDLPPSSLPPMPYSLQYVSPNQDHTRSSSHSKPSAHGSGTLYGLQSAGPPYQPALPMAPSPPFYPTQLSPSPTYSCRWVKEDHTLCEYKGSEIGFRKHFVTHLSGPQNGKGRCHWQGCNSEIRRDSMGRHARGCHLNIKRGT